MKAYRTLTIAPDFRRPPEGGVYVPRSDTAISSAAIYSRWPSRNARTQTLTMQLRGPSEVRDFRDFLNKARGNWAAFYCPSWMRDFGGVGSVSSGSRTMRIDADPTTWLSAGNRPDTYGRTVYVFNEARQLFVARILSASNAGGGNWDLSLDIPFPWAANLTTALCGIAWFVHFAGDEFTMEHIAPDRVEVEVGVIEGRNLTDVEGTTALPGQATIYQSEPFESVVEENAEPWKSDFRTMVALGPEDYQTAQGLNFSQPWTFTLTGGTVTMVNGATSLTSSLYNGDNTPDYISGAFDGSANEAIAWQQDFDTIRLRWFNSGTPQTLEIAGRTPLLFQNWTVNGAIVAGNADVILYYLKPGDSKIFARYQRDAFATEYTAATSPVEPLALIDNTTSGQKHVLRAMSTRHTRLGFYSENYLIPLEPQGDQALGTESVTIAANQIAVDAISQGDTANATETTSAAVNFMVIDATASGDAAAGTEQTSGAVNFMVIDISAGSSDNANAAETTSAAYNLIAIDATAVDTANATETTTGSCALP